MNFSLSLKSVSTWLDDHLLILLAGFLLAFIPLYPKLPLFDILPGYIVRVRLEDLLILLTSLIWGVQVLRQKIAWRTPVIWVMVAYAIAGLLTVISAVLITQTVPAELLHIGKSLLHYFRYLEYFSLFAILYSAIKTKNQVKILIAVMALTVLAIAIYGYGQRHFYWPVYSTMNREFSKGMRLYLTEHARVQSTFGGHYDMAAYLVVVLPILLALAFNVKRLVAKIALQLVHWIGVWLLIISASRSSFIAYVVGAGVVIGIMALNQKKWAKKISWGLSRGFFTFGIFTIMMLSFGEEIYDRFLQVLEGYPSTYQQYQHLVSEKNKFFEDTLPLTLGIKNLAIPKAEIPDNAMSTDDLLAQNNALASSDTRPTSQRPSDVYVDVPDIVAVATISASGQATTILVDKGPREFSECAQKRGLSTCIRLETLWPQAIAGFRRNPIFGSGYATLTKTDVGQFTEAESTDNNFLRTLGETGLLGFITFYGVMAVIIWIAIRQLFDQDAIGRALSVGLIASSVGLLVNAVYIDVFAASKVALTYWAVAGLVVAYTRINHPEFVNNLPLRGKKNKQVWAPLNDSNFKTTSTNFAHKTAKSSQKSKRKTRV